MGYTIKLYEKKVLVKPVGSPKTEVALYKESWFGQGETDSSSLPVLGDRLEKTQGKWVHMLVWIMKVQHLDTVSLDSSRKVLFLWDI
jgi:hypothetical protein